MVKRTKSSDDDLKRRKTVFKQRFPGFKKKVVELSVLCGNSVGFICYGPDNNVQAWPEPKSSLSEIVAKFKGQSDEKRNKNSCGINDFADLKGSVSAKGFDNHLISMINNQLEGVRQRKMRLVAAKKKKLLKGFSDETVEEPTNYQPRVINSEDPLGFGHELGYVVRASTGLNATSDALGVSTADTNLVVSDDDDTWKFCGKDEVFVDMDSLLANIFHCGSIGDNNLAAFETSHQPFYVGITPPYDLRESIN